MITRDWFDMCYWDKDPYDDWECIVYPYDHNDGFLEKWKPFLSNDFARFKLKAYCTVNAEDEHDVELYKDGYLYDCVITLEEEHCYYELARFPAETLDEALDKLVTAGNELDF